MTKVIIIGQAPVTNLKPIEFLRQCIRQDWTNTNRHPSEYDTIELIAKGFDYGSPTKGLDLMFAHNSDREDGVLFLGHFNDGIV